MSQPN